MPDTVPLIVLGSVAALALVVVLFASPALTGEQVHTLSPDVIPTRLPSSAPQEAAPAFKPAVVANSPECKLFRCKEVPCTLKLSEYAWRPGMCRKDCACVEVPVEEPAPKPAEPLPVPAAPAPSATRLPTTPKTICPVGKPCNDDNGNTCNDVLKIINDNCVCKGETYPEKWCGDAKCGGSVPRCKDNVYTADPSCPSPCPSDGLSCLHAETLTIGSCKDCACAPDAKADAAFQESCKDCFGPAEPSWLDKVCGTLGKGTQYVDVGGLIEIFKMCREEK